MQGPGCTRRPENHTPKIRASTRRSPFSLLESPVSTHWKEVCTTPRVNWTHRTSCSGTTFNACGKRWRRCPNETCNRSFRPLDRGRLEKASTLFPSVRGKDPPNLTLPAYHRGNGSGSRAPRSPSLQTRYRSCNRAYVVLAPASEASRPRANVRCPRVLRRGLDVPGRGKQASSPTPLEFPVWI